MCLPRFTFGNSSPGELASDTWEPGCLPSLSPPIFLLLPSCDLFQHSHLWPGTQPSQICYTDLLTSPQAPTRLKASGSQCSGLGGRPRSMSHCHLCERRCLQQSQASHPRKVVIDLWGISLGIRMTLHVKFPESTSPIQDLGLHPEDPGTIESFLPCNM